MSSTTSVCSAKDAYLRLEELQGPWLGREFPASSAFKDAVMREIAMLSSSSRLTYSRMSGIQAFQNGVALFVNAEGKDYENQFFLGRQGEMLMTWYAQKKQRKESPVIERMLNHEENGTRVMLFLRHPAEAYMNCGELRIVRELCDLEVIPMRICWLLVHFPKLKDLDRFQSLTQLSTV